MVKALSRSLRLLLLVEFERATMNVLSTLAFVKHYVIYSLLLSHTVKTLGVKCVTHFRISLFFYLYFY